MVRYIEVPTGQRCSDSVAHIQVSEEATGHKLAMAPFLLVCPVEVQHFSYARCYWGRACTCLFWLRLTALLQNTREDETNRRVISFFAQNVSEDSDQTPDAAALFPMVLFILGWCARCLGPRQKRQDKQQQRFEGGQPPPKFCANCVERARRRTIFGTFGVEGSSGARKCHSNASQPASTSQPGAMDHEVNCF